MLERSHCRQKEQKAQMPCEKVSDERKTSRSGFLRFGGGVVWPKMRQRSDKTEPGY